MSAALVPGFGHPLNLLLLASAGASAAWVGDWRPLAVGAAAQLVWMGLKPVLSRRAKVEARQLRADADEQARLRTLSEPLRRRYLELDRLRGDIRRLVEANPNLEAVGLERERVQVDRLLDGWLSLGAQVARMQAMLASETDTAASDESAAARARLEASEGELSQVETALVGLRDRVVSMTDPGDLQGELESLVLGVEAAERTARELEGLDAQRKRAVAASASSRRHAGS